MILALLLVSALANLALGWAVHYWHRACLAAREAHDGIREAYDVAVKASAEVGAKLQAAAQEGYRLGRVDRAAELAGQVGTTPGGAWAVNRLDSGAVHVKVVNDDKQARPVDVILPREVAMGLQAALARALLRGNVAEAQG